MIQNQGGFISKSPATITINHLLMLCKTEMMFFRVPQPRFREDTESYLSGWSVPSFFLSSSKKGPILLVQGTASVYDQVGSSQTTNRVANRQPKNW